MVPLDRLFSLGYVQMLLGVGADGILVAGWELRTVFTVDLDPMCAPQRATVLNQYRFLMTLEFPLGLFCLAHRREIFTRSRALRVFIGKLSAGVAARLGRWIADGTPRPKFIAFMALKFVTGAPVWIAVRKHRQT